MGALARPAMARDPSPPRRVLARAPRPSEPSPAPQAADVLSHRAKVDARGIATLRVASTARRTARRARTDPDKYPLKSNLVTDKGAMALARRRSIQ